MRMYTRGTAAGRWIGTAALGLLIGGAHTAYANHWLTTAPGTNWFDGANWQAGAPPTLTSGVSRLPIADAPGVTFEVHVGEPGGAEASGIEHSFAGNIDAVNLRVHSDLTIANSMNVRYPGLVSLTNGGDIAMGGTLQVAGDLYIGPGSSLTCNVLRIFRLGSDLVPRVVLDGGRLHVLGEGNQNNRFYVNYISLGQNGSTNPYRGELIMHGGEASLPTIGMARYSLDSSTHARLVVNDGTLTIRGEVDGIVGGSSESSVVEIEVNGGTVDVQNKRHLSLSGVTSRMIQRGGFVRAGAINLGNNCRYEISGGELLMYSGEGTLDGTGSVLRVIGPDPVITMNTFVYNALGAVEYMLTRSPGHIAPIKMNWEVRRLNTLPVGFKGGVLLAATNRFVLMNYTYGSRDETPPASTNVWITNWAAKDDTELAIAFTTPFASLNPTGTASAVFAESSAGLITIKGVSPTSHPDGLVLMLDIEARNGATLDSLLAGIQEAGYTNSSLSAAGAYSLSVVVPAEDLTAPTSYFAWDFETLFTNGISAVIRSVRIGENGSPRSAFILE